MIRRRMKAEHMGNWSSCDCEKNRLTGWWMKPAGWGREWVKDVGWMKAMRRSLDLWLRRQIPCWVKGGSMMMARSEVLKVQEDDRAEGFDRYR